ncbi:hypothetical protein K7711_14920 [Nocardia sp. CA2R105]|uniref:hypothetical protein n=1 Tax=Nocardia coffeae TaxID=2873381 RepID=UPI001CA69163|nr:hypothetical protein [Nocardia coffeae]MBY8857776.1 hypothetical protein [Nocardia coffeae]
MTDPDFASFGEPNRSRPDGYRLTHPRNEPATGSTNALTGFDPGRGSLGRPEVAVGWTPADPAPEWATGATPSVAPAPAPPGSNGDHPYGRSESLMSAPDSVAIRPDIGTSIAGSMANGGRQPENSSGTNGHQFPSAPTGSTFSAFDAPAGDDPRSANPAPGTRPAQSPPPAPNNQPPTTEFSAPTAPKPPNPALDSAFRTDTEPSEKSPGLPRRTPGVPYQFTDSEESDYVYSQPIMNLLDSQFDSPPPARRKSGGSGNLTNGSAFTSTEPGHLTNNSLLATVEHESATPPNSAEFGAHPGGPAVPPAPAPLPERRASKPGPEANSTAPDPTSTATASNASPERAARTRTTSGLTAPDLTDPVETPTAPAPPRTRMSRKAAERAAAAESNDETTSTTTESDPTAPRRTTVLPRTAPETRRTSSQDDVTKNVDVHLIMHLLLASHTLENIADKAEAGDVSLEEFIRAARRTRTAAVDLVSAWFGGADQMRQFAEALLAASDSA